MFKFILNLGLPIIFLHFCTSITHGAALPKGAWSTQERNLYHQRHFIELEQFMIEHHQERWVKTMYAQQDDLKGCLALHRGRGGLSELTACMRFAQRERELKLFSPGVISVAGDLDLLCEKLLKNEADVRFLAYSRVLKNSKSRWPGCVAAAWKQVYLTAAAKFDAEPVRVLAYVRTAEAGLPHDGVWADRSVKVIQRAQLARALK